MHELPPQIAHRTPQLGFPRIRDGLRSFVSITRRGMRHTIVMKATSPTSSVPKSQCRSTGARVESTFDAERFSRDALDLANDSFNAQFRCKNAGSHSPKNTWIATKTTCATWRGAGQQHCRADVKNSRPIAQNHVRQSQPGRGVGHGPPSNRHPDLPHPRPQCRH